jgi:biotin carboxyl carrier protein
VKFWVTLEGRDAEVEVRTERGRVWVEIEGRSLEADFCRLPDGEVYSLLVNGRSYEVRVAPSAGRLDVSIRSETQSVEVRHPLEKLLQQSRHASGRSDIETVAAPMPGMIVAIRVKPGDLVAAGQAVAVVEAMKMQNELAAKHGGRVSEVLVSERASVAAGQALMRLKSVEGAS